MADALEIEVRWKNRRESAHACSIRLLTLLRRLASHPVTARYSAWQPLSQTPTISELPIAFDADQLREVLAAGIQSTDLGNEIEELGFAGGIWCESHEHRISLLYWLGAFGAAARISFPNYCRIRLPACCEIDSQLRSVAVLEVMLIDLVNAFEPDIGWVSSVQLWNMIFKRPSSSFREAGWVFYLSDKVTTSAPKTQGFMTRHILDRGFLMTIADTQYANSSNQDQVLAVRKLTEDIASTCAL